MAFFRNTSSLQCTVHFFVLSLFFILKVMLPFFFFFLHQVTFWGPI